MAKFLGLFPLSEDTFSFKTDCLSHSSKVVVQTNLTNRFMTYIYTFTWAMPYKSIPVEHIT